MSNSLLDRWINIKLGDVLELKYGKSLPAKTRDGEGYPVYGSNGVVGQHSLPLVPTEGIIVGRKGSYGEVQLSLEPFFPIDTTYFIDELFEQPLKYWFYQLKNLPLTQLNRSTAIPGLNREDAYSQEIKLPPLAEQKVIAEKLDKLLAKVDSIKARLDAVPDTLKRFRQSVLAAAVSGKLTEEWRGKKDWDVQSDALSSFVKIDVGHAFKSKEFSEEGVPLLRGQNIEPGALKWNETKYFPEAKLVEHSKLFINEGDIILAMDRPIISTGLKLAIAKKEDLPCVLVQRVARFKEFNGLTPTYLYMLLSELSFMNYIQPNQTGSDIPHISGKQILNFKVNVPSIKEQEELTLRVEQLFAYADKVEAEVNATQERVNQLTQSILAKAFRGELTAKWREQNPELISGDNSAEALLEKIKNEREKLKPTKKRKAK
ncbi:restriction endonuclease subunit S [Alteromonas macleodii]|uniref:restriction endonuclease subunit S n=1 Tax=Alteromonas macleodii TaxID=28108 RepID=UPI00313FEA7E